MTPFAVTVYKLGDKYMAARAVTNLGYANYEVEEIKAMKCAALRGRAEQSSCLHWSIHSLTLNGGDGGTRVHSAVRRKRWLREPPRSGFLHD